MHAESLKRALKKATVSLSSFGEGGRRKWKWKKDKQKIKGAVALVDTLLTKPIYQSIKVYSLTTVIKPLVARKNSSIFWNDLWVSSRYRQFSFSFFFFFTRKYLCVAMPLWHSSLCKRNTPKLSPNKLLPTVFSKNVCLLAILVYVLVFLHLSQVHTPCFV